MLQSRLQLLVAVEDLLTAAEALSAGAAQNAMRSYYTYRPHPTLLWDCCSASICRSGKPYALSEGDPAVPCILFPLPVNNCLEFGFHLFISMSHYVLVFVSPLSNFSLFVLSHYLDAEM